MYFNIAQGSPIVKDMKINYREAVRAVILFQDKILLLQTKKGDYKFPGGGVEKNENHTDALKRELKEETGYTNCVVKEKIGEAVERHLDEYEENALFQMTSYYYICNLSSDEKVEQSLDDYELEQEFTPTWVTLNSAIKKNEECLKHSFYNEWAQRELLVLKELKSHLVKVGE
jgi:8-oxo-dGTP pyrophosphatase MutT (NUDIX family)